MINILMREMEKEQHLMIVDYLKKHWKRTY